MPSDCRSQALTEALSLAELPLQTEAQIVAVEPAASLEMADLEERLAEIGFLPGERVRLLARAVLGGPLAVRVGSDTFALRPAEAGCVRVMTLAGLGGIR